MHLLIALVLQATAPDAVAATPTAAETAQPAATAETTTQQPEVVCRWQIRTGERLRRRVCETAAAIEARAVVSAEATRDMQIIRGGSIITDEMAAGGMRP